MSNHAVDHFKYKNFSIYNKEAYLSVPLLLFSLQQQQQQIMAQMQLTHQALTLGQGNSTSNTSELRSGLGSLLGSKGTKIEAGTGGRERHLSEGFGGSTSTSGRVTLSQFLM